MTHQLNPRSLPGEMKHKSTQRHVHTYTYTHTKRERVEGKTKREAAIENEANEHN